MPLLQSITLSDMEKVCSQLRKAQKLLENVAGVFNDPASAYEALDIEKLLNEVGYEEHNGKREV